MGDSDVARRALLQQQLGRLDHRLGMEARAHDAVEQCVGDGHDRHALVVGHIGAHDGLRLAVGQPRRREVDAPRRSRSGHGHRSWPARRSSPSRPRVDHGGERGGVRCDDGVLAQAPLEAEARHAEVGVLVGEFLVARVVGRFGDAPRQTEADGIVDLAPDDQVVGLLDQAAERRPHDQRRHEVLEHRARPGDQRRATSDRRHRTPEPEPVARRHARPWRSPRSWRDEPRRPAGRSNWDRAGPRRRDSRSTAAGGPR